MRTRYYPSILRIRIPDGATEAWVERQLQDVAATVPIALSGDDADRGGLLLDQSLHYEIDTDEEQ